MKFGGLVKVRGEDTSGPATRKADANERMYIELQTRLDNLETVFKDFQAIQSEIEFLDESQQTLLEREQFENSYYDTIARAKGHILDHEAKLKGENTFKAGGMFCERYTSTLRLLDTTGGGVIETASKEISGPRVASVANNKKKVFVLQFREMVYLTEMHKITILQMIGYGDRTRTQAEVVRRFQEKYPELPPIFQGTISIIEKQFRERGHSTNQREELNLLKNSPEFYPLSACQIRFNAK
ncbi:hypothetical protein NQ318_011490 [Aromia moschata]|uniref:DUF4817 domain-containing protein n=1 Tax=Aromia moschata TaxID=1265417 RepID=A0AAV8Y0Z8_9CUCU|nr:hypothetical protein NQ318_011490 [Aromia moschata]